MTISMAFFTFFNAFWIAMVLPFGVEYGEAPDAEGYAAAPRRVNWRKKVAAAFIVSIVFTGGLAWMIHAEIIPLHNVDF